MANCLSLILPQRSSESLNANIPVEEYILQYIRVDDVISLVLAHDPDLLYD